MKIMLDKNAIMPTRAYPTDAGLDLYAPETVFIEARGSAVIDTGVHVELPPNTAGLIVSKSGLNTKCDIESTGLIDYSYSGSIRVKLQNHRSGAYLVNKGDKISQLVVIPIFTPELEVVNSLEEKGRANNGFGSSGK
jgi:dUTP pyrophosphatase